jgi:hypothetical protein
VLLIRYCTYTQTVISNITQRMEKKVDKLINLIEVNFNQLDNPLFKEVIFRLKNKDLLAFDILDYIFHNSIIKDENLLSSITNHSENLKSQLIQPLSSSEELFLNLSYMDLQTYLRQKVKRHF